MEQVTLPKEYIGIDGISRPIEEVVPSGFVEKMYVEYQQLERSPDDSDIDFVCKLQEFFLGKLSDLQHRELYSGKIDAILEGSDISLGTHWKTSRSKRFGRPQPFSDWNSLVTEFRDTFENKALRLPSFFKFARKSLEACVPNWNDDVIKKLVATNAIRRLGLGAFPTFAFFWDSLLGEERKTPLKFEDTLFQEVTVADLYIFTADNVDEVLGKRLYDAQKTLGDYLKEKAPSEKVNQHPVLELLSGDEAQEDMYLHSLYNVLFGRKIDDFNLLRGALSDIDTLDDLRARYKSINAKRSVSQVIFFIRLKTFEDEILNTHNPLIHFGIVPDES